MKYLNQNGGEDAKDESHLQNHISEWEIYVGQDVIDSINYFGSADGKLIEQNSTKEQRCDFTIRTEILWESETVVQQEVKRN